MIVVHSVNNVLFSILDNFPHCSTNHVSSSIGGYCQPMALSFTSNKVIFLSASMRSMWKLRAQEGGLVPWTFSFCCPLCLWKESNCYTTMQVHRTPGLPSGWDSDQWNSQALQCESVGIFTLEDEQIVWIDKSSETDKLSDVKTGSVFPSERAIPGIPRCNQRWAPEKQKKGSTWPLHFTRLQG